MNQTLAEKYKDFKDNVEVNRPDTTLLVDGHNTYIRSFTTVPVVNDNGEHFGGTLGFLRSLVFLIKRFTPTEVVIVFDGKGGSARRRKLYKDYKAGRKNKILPNRFADLKSPHTEEDSFVYQLRLLGEYLQHLPVKVLAFDNIEADDVIAHIANVRSEKGKHSTIVSSDKDFLQLVGDNITIYRPVKKKLYGLEEFKKDYGVTSSNFLFRRCFEGDASDNITGVSGVGHKTLIKLFEKYSSDSLISFEEAFNICKEEIENGSRKKVYSKILDQKDILIRNYKLMQLQDVDIAGTTKLTINDIVNRPSNTLNLFEFKKLFIRDRLTSTVRYFDNWINKSVVARLLNS